jgi:hypothetical protein
MRERLRAQGSSKLRGFEHYGNGKIKLEREEFRKV